MLTRTMRRALVAMLRRIPGARRQLQILLREGWPGYPVISRSEYPLDSRPRWGYGQPAHPELLTRIEAGRDHYRQRLEEFLTLKESLAAIPNGEPADAREPFWRNPYLPGLDVVALYGFLVTTKPETYLEVGSGNSTKVARRAVRDHGLPTRIVSIDPHPRAEVDGLCDRVVRTRAEDADPELFTGLRANDVLFIDNSHRSLMNSDATVFFLEVLPRLAPGVLVQVHDIFLPYDYPIEWRERYYSEQYLLACWLLAGGSLGIELPNTFVHRDPELDAVLAPLWDDPRVASGGNRTYPYIDWQRGGSSFWLRRS